MSKYWKYFKYVINYKKNYIKVSLDEINKRNTWGEYYYSNKKKFKLFVESLTHDMSKFGIHELVQYTNWFYGSYGNQWNNIIESGNSVKISIKTKHEYCYYNFNKAWIHHFMKNKHHWNYWCYDWNGFINNGRNGNYYSDLSYFKLDEPIDMSEKHINQMILDWKAMSLNFGDTPQEYYMNNYHEIELSINTRFLVECKLGLQNLLNASYCDGNWEFYCTLYEIANMYKFSKEDLLNDLFRNIDNLYHINSLNCIRK